MERLTEKRDGQNVIPLRQDGKLKWALCNAGMGNAPTQFLYGVYADKLAKYEDLEKRICAIYGECDGLLEMVIEHLERHENIDIPEPVFKARLLTDGMVDRWEEYKNLDEQGKLLKLPCAVGDMVYYISEKTEKQGRKRVTVEFIDKGTVDNIALGSLMIPQITVCNSNNEWTAFDGVEDFGKTVFLTKGEAEAALKKMEESK